MDESEGDPLAPRHPTQLYEALSYLAIFAFMFWYYGKKHGKVLHGHLFGVFLILMFTFRFILEYTKINEGIDEDAILNMGQILSIPFVLAGIAIAYLRHKTVKATEITK